MNNVLIASDHAGFKLKKTLIEELQGEIKFEDLGPFSESSVDYPDYARKLSKKIDLKKDLLGVLICGSGIGMSMVANRFKNVRAALCMNDKMSMLARQHNNANILVLGSRLISEQEAIKCFTMFFKSEFEGGRHQARLAKFNHIESIK